MTAETNIEARGRLTSDPRVMTAFATVVALLVVAVAYLVARTPVEATHQPANKAVAFGEELMDVPSGADVPIMTATLKTSKPTDLIMNVTLECAILTKLFTSGGGSAVNSSQATTNASIKVWIEEPGYGILPISSSSAPPQNRPPKGGDDDKVTFCQREEGRRVDDTENDDDGIDEQNTFQDTKSANAFNWVVLNAGSGVHTFIVKATLDEDAPCSSDLAVEDTCSDALIGNRTFIIHPERMANDASV